jgi:hypothetical protein
MIDTDKQMDNISALDALIPRRPGPLKGLPKPPGSGRKRGTPNKVGKEARELAAKYTDKAFEALAKLLDSADERVVAIAAQQLLDRRFGKPSVSTEITGKDGAPVIEPAAPVSDIEAARAIMFRLAKAEQHLGKDRIRRTTL